MSFEIPDRLYFKIGEVAKLIGVEPYVLRYWESEFPEISPTKSKSNQRLYKHRDVELIAQIRELLYTHKFTIDGAKLALDREGRSNSKPPLLLKKDLCEIVQEMENFLR